MKPRVTALIALFGIAVAANDTVVTGTTRYPIPACLVGNAVTFRAGASDCPCEANTLSLNLPSLKATLEPQGVTFEPYVNVSGKRQTKMQFPQATAPVILAEYGPWAVPWQADRFDVQPDRDYIAASDLIAGARTIGLTELLEGWETVRLKIGATTTVLSQQSKPISPALLYFAVFYPFADNVFPKRDLTEALTFPLDGFANRLEQSRKYRVQISDGANAIYLVLTRETGRFTQNGSPRSSVRLISLVRSDNLGRLEFMSRASSTQLAERSDQLEPIALNDRGEAVMLRFTGRLEVGAQMFAAVAPDGIVKLP